MVIKFTKLLDSGSMRNTPYLIYVIMFINVSFYAMATTVVFSFLPKMVQYFGATELNTGIYAGVIGSSLYVGRFFFSMLWGYATDILGKKKSAVLSGTLLMVTTLAFGFSQNFYWAGITRFLQGCCMGQIIVHNALLRNICEERNIAVGMSVVMTAFTSGSAFGPSIGGFLVFPVELYPNTFSKESIFNKFPILLPNIVISIGLMIGVLLTLKFIPNDNTIKVCSSGLADSSARVSYGSTGANDVNSTTETAALATEYNNRLTISCIQDNSKLTNSTETKVKRKPSFLAALKNKDCIMSAILYCLFSIVDIGFKEMFPVLAATNPEYKGLGFSSSDIGTILMAVTLFLTLFQVTLLPKLNECFGSKNVLTASTLSLAFLCPMLPVIAAIENRIIIWASLALLLLLIQATTFLAYHSINIFVNNSVGPDIIGSANGIALTFASIGRLIAPSLCGAIYSWSLTNIKGINVNKKPLGFPFDNFLVFYFLSMWAIVVAIITSCLPDSMNHLKNR